MSTITLRVTWMVVTALSPQGTCLGWPSVEEAAEVEVEAVGSCSVTMAVPGAAPLLLARERPEITPDDQVAQEDVSSEQRQQGQQQQHQQQTQTWYSVEPQQQTQNGLSAAAAGKMGEMNAENTECDCSFILYEEHQCEQSPHLVLSGWDVHNNLGQLGKLASSLRINKVGCNITLYADRGLTGLSATYEGIEENSCFDLLHELDDNAGSAITSDRCPLSLPPSTWPQPPTMPAPAASSCLNCTKAWVVAFISLIFALVSLSVSVACCLCPRLFGSKVSGSSSGSSRIIQVH